MPSAIKEEGVSILAPKGVFYNPQMELCRSMFSLFVGAIGRDVSVLDAMCASGVRGLRYKKENKNVISLALLDISRRAAEYAKKNARANKVKCLVENADVAEFLLANEFDFIELDPFGTPVPYLHDAARSFRTKKNGYVSVTATDMAVLCGAHRAACLKNYGAAPLNNEFCHENAARILVGKAVLAFAQFNLAAEPMLTLSHRHYVKIGFGLSQSAQKAVEAVKTLGFVSYCQKCCWRAGRRIPLAGSCPECGNALVFAGPMHLGGLWDVATLRQMLELNAQRDYGKKKEIGKLLETMLAESQMDSLGYYDLHVLAKKMGHPIKRIEGALSDLRSSGFHAERTHFSPTAIRTDATHKAVIEAAKLDNG